MAIGGATDSSHARRPMMLSAAVGPPAPQDWTTAYEAFLAAADKYPDHLALACVHQPANLCGIPNEPLDDDSYQQKPYLRWTYKSLQAGIDRLAAGLRAAGVVPGMPIITFNTNSAEHTLIQWASTPLGCPFCPINPRNLANEAEVVHMIKTAMSVAPVQRLVVMTSDPKFVRDIEQLGLVDDAIKIVTAPATETPAGWLSFEQLMAQPPSAPVNGANGWPEEQIADGMVLFTSGTTSSPKGTFKRNSQWATIFETFAKDSDPDAMRAGSKFCCVLPNNHAFSFILQMFIQTVGGALVYPGPSFQTDIMLETLYREKITQVSTALVPTMIHALAGLKESLSYQLEHLVSVMFAGAVLTPDVLQLTTQALGAKGVENLFGMTEGMMIKSGNQRDLSKLMDGEDVTVGRVCPGYAIKITDPDTDEVVPVNTPGMLQASAAILRHYIGGVGMDSFNTDEDGREWFISGDQARMDERGRVFITGRYKDMLIRGGENMSPTAIEMAISKDPELLAMMPQIVGARDPIAGDVPVAVLMGKVDARIKEAVQHAVLKHMGNIYIPEEVLSLSDLGLSDYPRTMAGKVQKVKLTAMVRQYLKKHENDDLTAESGSIAAELIDIWARAVGLDPSKLALDTQIGEFADSITVMRVRDMIQRKTGKKLSLQDMTNAGTIGGQINLLKQQASTAAEGVLQKKRPTREGSPRGEEMSHLIGNPDLIQPTKDLITKAISPLGLGWDDVEDVIPAYDFANMMIEVGIYHSFTFRFAMVANKAGKPELRKALEAVLQNNRIMASYFVQDYEALGLNTGLHVAIRQNKKFFDKIFRDGGKLGTVSELNTLANDFTGQITYPGPLARLTLYDIEERGAAGVVLELDHVVLDASMGLIFMADLDKALGGVPLPTHVDYKLWADSYHNQRTSASARAAVQWHVRRLRGLGQHRKALWTPFRMPRERGELLMTDAEYANSAFCDFRARGLRELRRRHPGITPVAVLKTALVLLNVRRSGHTHALFANLEAARAHFPFLARELEATGHFEASDVSGPTIQTVINLVEVRPAESVLALLARVQEDQAELTKHAAAPIEEIMAQLGPELGALIPEIFGRQLFNWVPGMGAGNANPHQNFEEVAQIARPRLGLSLNTAVGGPESDTVYFVIRGSGFDHDGYRQIAEDMEKLTLWLVNPENWERPSGEYGSAFE